MATTDGSSFLQGLHVLFVDDSPDERDLFAMRLGMYGADVTTAGSVPEAVAILENGETDLVVTDIVLPEYSGYDLVDAMHDLAPDHGSAIPTLAVTGYAEQRERARMHEAGFTECLVKPYSTNQLLSAINGCAASVERLRAIRRRCREQWVEQHEIRGRLVARRSELEYERARLLVRFASGPERRSACEALALLGASRFAEAGYGAPPDELEVASAEQHADGSSSWLVCAIVKHQIAIVEVAIGPKGDVTTRPHAAG